MLSLSSRPTRGPAPATRLEALRAEHGALIREREQLTTVLATEEDLEVAAALGDATAVAQADVVTAARVRLPEIAARLAVINRALQVAAAIDARNLAAAELGFARSVHDSYRARLGLMLALLDALAVEQRAIDQVWTEIMDAQDAARVLLYPHKDAIAPLDVAVPDADLLLVHFTRRWFNGGEASAFAHWRAEAVGAGIAPADLTITWKR